MATDQAGAPNQTLRFPAGRFEDSILTAIFAVQFSLGGVGLLMGAFVLLAEDGFTPPFIATAAVPFAVAYLLTFLYESTPPRPDEKA